MQKEIFEQPESVVNTMRGRVNFEECKGQSAHVQIVHVMDWQRRVHCICDVIGHPPYGHGVQEIGGSHERSVSRVSVGESLLFHSN